MTNDLHMNDYYSVKMAAALSSSHDIVLTDDEAEADVILIKTSSIREKAQEKVFSQLGRWRPIKEERPDVVIGVAGCVASQEGENIISRSPFVDMVFGPQTIHRLPKMLDQVRSKQQPVVDISFPEIEKLDKLNSTGSKGSSGLVSIM